MATYYVAGTGNDTTGTGATGNPWRSLNKAHTSSANGDTIIVRNGTYEEQLQISKAGQTWRADTGHTPVVNGRYHIGLMSGGNTITKTSTMPRIDSSGTYLPGGTNGKAALIFINANNVTVDGFVVQNSTGSGISISGSNATVKNCVTYFTYSSGILSNPSGNISGLLVENNIVRFASVKIFDTARFTNYAGNCSFQCVDGSMKFGNNTGNTIIRGNDVAWGFGEGINIGKYNNATAANPIIIEDNLVHDVNHTYYYINASRFVHVRNNIAYCSNIAMNMWDGDAPVGIRLADEKETYLRDIFVYNNVVVNLGYAMEWGGRHTESTGCYFGYNTFVGGPNSRKPAVFVVKSEPANNYAGGFNQKGILENNVIDYSMASSLAVANNNNTTGASGVTFRNNNWSKTPPNAAAGAGDVVGLPRLVNNGRVLATSEYPTKADTDWADLTDGDNMTIADYQLTSSSPGRGAASNGTAASGVTPPTATGADYYGNSRDATPADRDVGAFEFNGVVANDVIADFSGTPRSGTAPLSVTFTDLSTTSGAAVINAWSWTFGDGGTSTSRNPTRNYAAAGTYTVALTVQDTTRSLTDTVTRTGYIVVGSPPTNSVTAGFSGAPRNGAAPHTVNFTNASTVSGAAVINSYAWNFGDSGTATTASPSHTYAAAGTYTVSLTVQDTTRSLSDVETKAGYVVVTAANDITADFSWTPSGGDAPVEIDFTDESTGAGAAAADTWLWDFGDGDTATTQNPTHEYTAAGSYTVTLTVTDAGLGISDSVSLGPIIVTATPDPTVTADFTTDGDATGEVPLTVQFVDLSGGSVTTWLWSFGDGTTSTSRNPVHVYEQEGEFDVSLTVTDGASATDTKTEVGYISATYSTPRRYVVPMVLTDEAPPRRASISHYDYSDDADTGRSGYADVATNRPRPAVWLSEQADEPDAVTGELVIWFDEDGTLKAKLPNGTVKVLDWT